MKKRIILLLLAIGVAPIALPLFLLEGGIRMLMTPFYWVVKGGDMFEILDSMFVLDALIYIEDNILTRIK